MRRHLTARDLGFTVEPGDEAALFKWLLASMLFGHRIAQTIAARTWRVLVDAGIDTPHALAGSRHAALVRMLGEGGYRRYDESTARRLARLGRTLVDDYGGRVLGIAEHPFKDELPNTRVLGLHAQFSINRLDFHVGESKWTQMGVMGETIDLTIDMELLQR